MENLKVRMVDGGEVIFEEESFGSGVEKVAFRSRDHRHVVCFYYGEMVDRAERKNRLENIIGRYNPTCGHQGQFWESYYCWPVGIVDGDPSLPSGFVRKYGLVNPVLGVISPAYPSNYFFRDRTGSLREKKGKWFTSPKARKLLPESEKGNFLKYLQVCTKMARAVRRLHFAGLAHSDLSHNNVLIDPKAGDACLIDIDSLVVPGVAPPTVLGTPGYIAPEVVSGAKLPSIETDLHALAVLIYETLLLRHPLKGPKVRSTVSSEWDERLSMGEQAIFVEHPADKSNHLKPPPALPISRLGRYVERLFLKTFVDGLHNPGQRATAADWEKALSRTFDILHPSPLADQWFVLEKGMPMRCAYSGRKLAAPVPFAECYRDKGGGEYVSEDRSLTIWHNMLLHRWHLFTNLSPTDTQHDAQGYFSFYQDRWHLVNTSSETMVVIGGVEISKGEAVVLRSGLRLLLSKQQHGRLLVFDFVSP